MTALLFVLALFVSAVPAPAMAANGTDVQQVSIAEIQTPTDNTTASPYAGQNVTTNGTVTAVNADGFYIQDGTANHSGVYVYGSANVSAGDRVTVTGTVEENYQLTRIALENVTVTGTAAVPDPVSLSTGDVSQEAYEGMLVTVSSVNVTAAPGQYGEWAVDDGSGSVAVDDVTTGDDTVPEEAGGTIESLTGPVFYSFSQFKIQPKAITGFEPASDGQTTQPVANGTTLTVVSYNDLQTAVSNPERMGKLAYTIEERRNAHENPTIVVGGGDQVSPSSLSPVSNWTVPIQVLNRIDPAAEVVGNHDLDYGFEPVANYSAASEFPWLLANVRAEDGSNVPGTQNYTVVERGNVTIGVVGLVDDAIKTKTAVDFEANGYTVTDYNKVGKRIATKLKEDEDVDFVVALAHIGVGESEDLARNTENIDLIVTGDDEVLHEPQTTSGTVIMEAGGNAEAVAEANFTVNDTEARFSDGRLVAIGDSTPVNESVRTLVNESRGQYLSTVAGRTTVPLDSTSANYADETRWGNLVTDAFIAQTGADVAVTNAGGMRGNFVIPPGNVTYDDVYTSLPFGNTLVTKRLNGTELKYFLASQVGVDDQYGFETNLQVSGVHYEVNARQDGMPVDDVYVRGEPLKPNATYTVTFNSYMAGWEKLEGQPYSIDVAGQPTVSEDLTLYGTAAVRYIEANSPVSPADTNRIRRVTHEAGPVTLTPKGGDTLRATFSVPDSVESVNASSFYAQNASHGTVEATSVEHDAGGDTVTVAFDRSEYGALEANSTEIQLYGKYNTSAVDLIAFDQAVLNAELSTAGKVTERYDTDNNGVETDELRTAISDWVENDLGTEGLRALIRAWVTANTPAS